MSSAVLKKVTSSCVCVCVCRLRQHYLSLVLAGWIVLSHDGVPLEPEMFYAPGIIDRAPNRWRKHPAPAHPHPHFSVVHIIMLLLVVYFLLSHTTPLTLPPATTTAPAPSPSPPCTSSWLAPLMLSASQLIVSVALLSLMYFLFAVPHPTTRCCRR